MRFTVCHPNGTRETRRHVPYKATKSGGRWEAHHAETGRLQARADTREQLDRIMSTLTEPA